MWLVNGIILSKKNLPEVWAWYEEKIKEIKSRTDKEVYLIPKKKKNFTPTETGGRVHERQYTSVPTTSTFFNDELEENQTWEYAQTASAVKTENGVSKVSGQKPWLVSWNTSYNTERDFDLIFFYENISNAVRNKKIFKKDPRKENNDQAGEGKLVAHAMSLVYGDDSPISEIYNKSDEPLKRIAVAWGVTVNKNSFPSEIKNSLWSIIQKSNSDGARREAFGYEAFIKSVDNIKLTMKRAVIFKAIEEGILVLDEETLQWQLIASGSEPMDLCVVQPNEYDKRNDIIVDLVFGREDLLSIISQVINTPAGSRADNKYNENSNREEMINIAKDLGWTNPGFTSNKELARICNLKLTSKSK